MRILLIALSLLALTTPLRAQNFGYYQPDPCPPPGPPHGLLDAIDTLVNQRQRMDDCKRAQQAEIDRAQAEAARKQIAHDQTVADRQSRERVEALRQQEQIRRETVDRSRAQKVAAERAESAKAAQLAAEKSPDNFYRKPDVARQLMSEFNAFRSIKRAGVEAIDIEHLVTVKLDSETHQIVCHGRFLLTSGESLVGTFTMRPNVAGDLISTWVVDGSR